MFHTGKYATEEEIEKIRGLVKTAEDTPVIALSSQDALDGNDMSTQAWKRVYDLLNKTAGKYGLPEIIGNYGLSADGEFLTMEDEN